MDQQAMYEELRSLGAATVYEAQGAKGALDCGIKPIDPASRLVGPALTVDTRPADNLMLHYALSKARPGDVLVVDAKGFLEAGPWGDVLTVAAMKIGVAGLVINGAVRDANTIVEIGFPGVLPRAVDQGYGQGAARQGQRARVHRRRRDPSRGHHSGRSRRPGGRVNR
jgi:regulator of RNase E activity RraA